MLPSGEAEFVGRFGLVGDVFGHLIAALRIKADRLGRIDRSFRKRSDVVEHRALNPALVTQGQVRRNRDFASNRADVLLNAVIIAVDESIESVAVDAEIRIWAAGSAGKFLGTD